MKECSKCGFRWDPESIKDPDDCRECEASRLWNLVVQLEHDIEASRDEARELLGEESMPAGLKYVVQVLVARLREKEAQPS